MEKSFSEGAHKKPDTALIHFVHACRSAPVEAHTSDSPLVPNLPTGSRTVELLIEWFNGVRGTGLRFEGLRDTPP